MKISVKRIWKKKKKKKKKPLDLVCIEWYGLSFIMSRNSRVIGDTSRSSDVCNFKPFSVVFWPLFCNFMSFTPHPPSLLTTDLCYCNMTCLCPTWLSLPPSTLTSDNRSVLLQHDMFMSYMAFSPPVHPPFWQQICATATWHVYILHGFLSPPLHPHPLTTDLCYCKHDMCMSYMAFSPPVHPHLWQQICATATWHVYILHGFLSPPPSHPHLWQQICATATWHVYVLHGFLSPRPPLTSDNRSVLLQHDMFISYMAFSPPPLHPHLWQQICATATWHVYVLHGFLSPRPPSLLTTDLCFCNMTCLYPTWLSLPPTPPSPLTTDLCYCNMTCLCPTWLSLPPSTLTSDNRSVLLQHDMFISYMAFSPPPPPPSPLTTDLCYCNMTCLCPTWLSLPPSTLTSDNRSVLLQHDMFISYMAFSPPPLHPHLWQQICATATWHVYVLHGFLSPRPPSLLTTDLCYCNMTCLYPTWLSLPPPPPSPLTTDLCYCNMTCLCPYMAFSPPVHPHFWQQICATATWHVYILHGFLSPPPPPSPLTTDLCYCNMTCLCPTWLSLPPSTLTSDNRSVLLQHDMFMSYMALIFQVLVSADSFSSATSNCN